MPKAYAVVTYRSISDPEKLAAYAKLALPAVTPFGARILARGDAAVAREQGLKERTVVVEYPSLEKATAAYNSVAYAEALKALGDGAVRDFRIVEGVEWDYHLTAPELRRPCHLIRSFRGWWCAAVLSRRTFTFHVAEPIKPMNTERRISPLR
jgi:uncharacterized protein (DUF1330 family)